MKKGLTGNRGTKKKRLKSRVGILPLTGRKPTSPERFLGSKNTPVGQSTSLMERFLMERGKGVQKEAVDSRLGNASKGCANGKGPNSSQVKNRSYSKLHILGTLRDRDWRGGRGKETHGL